MLWLLPEWWVHDHQCHEPLIDKDVTVVSRPPPRQARQAGQDLDNDIEDKLYWTDDPIAPYPELKDTELLYYFNLLIQWSDLKKDTTKKDIDNENVGSGHYTS